MGILQLLDEVPEAITRSPAQLWSVLARSLGEQGASGRTALAWRWALTGTCPSPVTLTAPAGRPPSRGEIVAESGADAELARQGIDPGGDVMQAQFVLKWLTSTIDALPLWNGGLKSLHVTDGADYPHCRADVEEAYLWALLGQDRHPWCAASSQAVDRKAFGWARGAVDLLSWVCGEVNEGPLSGNPSVGRPTLYEVSLDACRAMTGVRQARQARDPMRAARLESFMETFLWLAGWNPAPSVDRHGRGAQEDCPDHTVR
jgi:hypothetical protein